MIADFIMGAMGALLVIIGIRIVFKAASSWRAAPESGPAARTAKRGWILTQILVFLPLCLFFGVALISRFWIHFDLLLWLGDRL